MNELTPYRPFRGGFLAPFDLLRREVDRLFEDATGDGLEQTRVGLQVRMNVEETDHELLVTAEIPGVEPQDIEVSVTGGVLCIRGEKRMERDDKQAGRRLWERAFGAFERRLALPPGIETQAIEAEHKHGVLAVRLPKSKEAQSDFRKIEIKSN